MSNSEDKFIPIPNEEIQEEVVQYLDYNLTNMGESLCSIPSATQAGDIDKYAQVMNCTGVDCGDCWFYFKHKHKFIELILGERNED